MYGIDDGIEQSVKGLVRMRCWKCGYERTYYVGDPITHHTCWKCGCLTSVDGLRKVFAVCECGFVTKLKTNLSDEFLDIPCARRMPADEFGRTCGNPITVKWIPMKRQYENC